MVCAGWPDGHGRVGGGRSFFVVTFLHPPPKREKKPLVPSGVELNYDHFGAPFFLHHPKPLGVCGKGRLLLQLCLILCRTSMIATHQTALATVSIDSHLLCRCLSVCIIHLVCKFSVLLLLLLLRSWKELLCIERIA